MRHLAVTEWVVGWFIINVSKDEVRGSSPTRRHISVFSAAGTKKGNQVETATIKKHSTRDSKVE